MYGSVAGFINYHESRGVDVSLLDTAMIEPALTRASAILDSLYESRFHGTRLLGMQQEYSWPRKGRFVQNLLIAENEIPLVVEWATYELALMEMREPGSLIRLREVGERVKRVTIGPITEEYAIQQGSAGSPIGSVIFIIEGMMSPLLKRSDFPLPSVMTVW